MCLFILLPFCLFVCLYDFWLLLVVFLNIFLGGGGGCCWGCFGMFVCFLFVCFLLVSLLFFLFFGGGRGGVEALSFCFNRTTESVAFRLHVWCMPDVFLLPAFIRLGHEHQVPLSSCDEMHACMH